MLTGILRLFASIGVAVAFTYTVTVGIDEATGNQGIGFDPSVIMPSAGDIVTFTFQLPGYVKKPLIVQHSVTQSTFDNPCAAKTGGFDTGTQSTGSISANTGNIYNLLINDTQPLWFFSTTGSDCKSGMVLAVNPPTTGDQTAEAFNANAVASSGSTDNASTSNLNAPSQTTLPNSEETGTSQTTGTETAAHTISSPPPPPPNAINSEVSISAKVELGLAAMVAIVGVAFAA